MPSLNSLIKIDSNIYLKNVELDGYDVRGALILGTEKAIIFDTLAHPDDMDGYNDIIGEREIIIVYSHADWDHIWGTAGVNGAVKSIIAHEHCLARFSKDVPDTLKEYQNKQPELFSKVQLIPPNIVINSEIEIDLGGITVQLSPLAGHTADSIVAYIPEKGVLLAGDTVETPFPCLGKESPVAEWILKLDEWSKKKELKTVIPAHGDISGPDILVKNIQYLKDIMNGVDIPIDPNLSSFYKETHHDNKIIAKKQTSITTL